MGSKVGATVGAKLRAVGSELERANSTAGARAAMVMKRTMEVERDKAAPGGRLRNVGKSGARLGISYTITGTRDLLIRFTATGPWPLLERVVHGHTIRPRRRRGTRAVSTPFGPRAVVHTSDTHPKKPWEKGVDAGVPVALPVLRNAYSDAAKRGFRS